MTSTVKSLAVPPGYCSGKVPTRKTGSCPRRAAIQKSITISMAICLPYHEMVFYSSGTVETISLWIFSQVIIFFVDKNQQIDLSI